MMAVNKLQNPGQSRVLPEKIGSLSLRELDVGLTREATGAGVGSAVASLDLSKRAWRRFLSLVSMSWSVPLCWRHSFHSASALVFRA